MIHRISQLIAPPVFEGDEQKNRAVGFLNIILWAMLMGAILAIPLVIIAPAETMATRLVATISVILLSMVLIKLMRSGYLRLVGFITVFGVWAITNLAILFGGGGVRSIGFPGNIIVVLMAGIVLGRRAALSTAGLCIATGLAFTFARQYGWIPDLPPRDTDQETLIIYSIHLVVSAVLLNLSLRNAEHALTQTRHERQKYRNIFDNAIDGIFQSTPDGRFVSVNPAMARMYGYDSPYEMLHSITDISSQLYVEPELRIDLRRRLEAGEKITGFEALEYRKDKSIFWISMNTQAIHDEQGKILYYEGTAEDITKRKLADEALRKSEERYRTLFNEIPDGVYRSSRDGRFLDVNPAMLSMFGYASREEMLKVDIQEELYFTPEERENLFLDTSQEKVDEYRLQRNDGTEIWVEDHGYYVYDEQGTIIYQEGILRDITPRRMAEAERERLIKELAAKNTELEQFTYTVSHDLKAPLITINGFLGYLEEDAAAHDLEHVKADGQRIREAVAKMHLLLNELLELSRIGRMMNEPETVNFADLLQSALDNVQGRLEAGHVSVQVQHELPDVYGDRQRLMELLQNLLDNAAKFMGSQPEPRIEVGQRGEEHGRPIFFIRDNGIGIAAQYHTRIFGLFNKLDAKAEGTGIGLAIVERIVEVHGGRIWVESEVGQGTTFYFSLPRPPSA